MKICILSAVNIKHMSLISLYTDILKREGIEYDLIYMDKYGEDEPFECAHKYRYRNVVKQKLPKPLKAFKYMMFLPWAKRILKREKYDFVIVWNDVAIFMFAKFLAKHYKGKYCLNVRDNMKYDQHRYDRMYKACFENSAFNTISSKGYLDFLPKGPAYIQLQSLNLAALGGAQPRTALRPEGKPIRIGFVGYVRFYERNKKLMEAFRNDPRFELCFYGKNADVLRAYAEEQGIENTSFHDSFPVEDTKIYLDKIDVMNNLYGNENINLRKAISIKTFHAMYMKIPLLVTPGTYNAEFAGEVGIGFELGDGEIAPGIADKLYAWYRALDFDRLSASCEAQLEAAKRDNAIFEKTLLSFVKKN